MKAKNLIFIIVLVVLIIASIVFSVIPKDLLLCQDILDDDKFQCNKFFYFGFSILGVVLQIILIILLSKVLNEKKKKTARIIVIIFLVLLILGQVFLTMFFNVEDWYEKIKNQFNSIIKGKDEYSDRYNRLN
jgi:hypothetical protein